MRTLHIFQTLNTEIRNVPISIIIPHNFDWSIIFLELFGVQGIISLKMNRLIFCLFFSLSLYSTTCTWAQTSSESASNKFVTVVTISGLGVVLILTVLLGHGFARRRDKILMHQTEQILNSLREQQVSLLQGTSALKLSAPSEVPGYVSPFEMINDSNPRIRSKGIEVVEAELVNRNEDNDVAQKILDPLLEDNNNRVKANAAKTLYKYNPEVSISIIKEMFENEDKWMNASAAWACEQLPESKEAIELLLKHFPHFDKHVNKRIEKSLLNLLQSKNVPNETKEKINDILKTRN